MKRRRAARQEDEILHASSEETIAMTTSTVSTTHHRFTHKSSPLPEALWALIYSYFNGLYDRSQLACTCRDLAKYRRHPLAVLHINDTHLSHLARRSGWIAELKHVTSVVGSFTRNDALVGESTYQDLIQNFPKLERLVVGYPSSTTAFECPRGLKELHLHVPCHLSNPPLLSLGLVLNRIPRLALDTLVSLSFPPLSFADLLFLPLTLTWCKLSLLHDSLANEDSSRGWYHFFGLPHLHSVTLSFAVARTNHMEVGGWSRLERNLLLMDPSLPVCQWRQLRLYAASTMSTYTTPSVSSLPTLPLLQTFEVDTQWLYTEDDWDHWVKIAPGITDLTLESYGPGLSREMKLYPVHRWPLQRLCLSNMAKTPLHSLTAPLPPCVDRTTSSTTISSLATPMSLFRSISSLRVCWSPYEEPGAPSVWYRVLPQLSSSSSLLHLHLQNTHADSNFFDIPDYEPHSYHPVYDGRHCEDIFTSVTRHLPQLRSFKCRSKRPPTSPHVLEGLLSLCHLHTLGLFYDEIDTSGTFYERLAISLPPLLRHLTTHFKADTGPQDTRVVEQMVLCAGRQLQVWEINAHEWTRKDNIEWMKIRLAHTLCSLLLLDPRTKL